jgi:hypothetical protein
MRGGRALRLHPKPSFRQGPPRLGRAGRGRPDAPIACGSGEALIPPPKATNEKSILAACAAELCPGALCLLGLGQRLEAARH